MTTAAAEIDRKRERGLRLIQRCATEPDVPALVDEFIGTTRDFGFDAVACGGWTGLGDSRPYRFYFNTWPPDWLEFYNQRQLFFKDPIVMEAQRRVTPYLWSELEMPRDAAAQAQDTVALALDYGWTGGLAVPLHGPSGYQGLVSLATFGTLALQPGERELLWVMAIAVHDRCRTSPGMGLSSTAVPELSPREIQCMRWVAAGKTDWEIAQLLGIAKSTAHYHVERVKRRLGTRGRTQAVALLVLHGVV